MRTLYKLVSWIPSRVLQNYIPCLGFVSFSLAKHLFCSTLSYGSQVATWLQHDFVPEERNGIAPCVRARVLSLHRRIQLSTLSRCISAKVPYGVDDLFLWIPDDSCLITERAFSSFGIESRSPFLMSRSLYQFVSQFSSMALPRAPKQSLIQAFKHLWAPGFFNRPKWGWLSPVQYWLELLSPLELEKALDPLNTDHRLSSMLTRAQPLKWSQKWKLLILSRAVYNQFSLSNASERLTNASGS